MNLQFVINFCVIMLGVYACLFLAAVVLWNCKK